MSGRIPGNATLLFEVELKKLKLSKEREAEESQRWVWQLGVGLGVTEVGAADMGGARGHRGGCGK